jgi:predicted patatin/cPLA2 family phospholipase
MATKRGLVIEGGGMRGAHTCGVFMGMTDAGLTTPFDVVAASSAGACTAAYWVSGQGALFPRIWADFLHDGRFLNPFRFFTGGSAMDLDYLIDEVFGKIEPLNLKALRETSTKFFVATTDCQTGEEIYFNNHDYEILPVLKASAALPLAYRGPVSINDRLYMDGGIAAPIPIQKVLDEGCDDVTILLTRPEGYRKKNSILNLLPYFYRRRFPELAKTLARRHEIYNRSIIQIEDGKLPCRLTIIRPLVKLPVGRMTSNRAKILQAIEQGRQEARLVLGV